MTDQPKRACKMADFETLTLYISLKSSQTYTYFCQDLVTGCCLYVVKKLISNRHPFSNSFYFPHLVAMDLMSCEIRVQMENCTRMTIGWYSFCQRNIRLWEWCPVCCIGGYYRRLMTACLCHSVYGQEFLLARKSYHILNLCFGWFWSGL